MHSAFKPFICCAEMLGNLVGTAGFTKNVMERSPPKFFCVRHGMGGVLVSKSWVVVSIL